MSGTYWIWLLVVFAIYEYGYCSSECGKNSIVLRDENETWFEENSRCLYEISKLLKVDARNVNISLRSLIAFLQSIRSDELEILNMKDSYIKTVFTDAFYHFVQIDKIDLVNNNIMTLQEKAFNNLTNLHYIDLSNNDLTSIGSSVFVNLPKLERIFLYNNRLSIIENNAFVEVALETDFFSIHLLNNNLTTINRTVLPRLDMLYNSSYYTLTVNENPWQCSCELVWLVEYVQKYNKSKNIWCHAPKNISMLEFDLAVCNNSEDKSLKRELSSEHPIRHVVIVLIVAISLFTSIISAVCGVWLWRKKFRKKPKHCKMLTNRHYYRPKQEYEKQYHFPDSAVDNALLKTPQVRHDNARYKEERQNMEDTAVDEVVCGKLRLEKLIGRGAFGEVYEGFDTGADKEGRRVAVKRVKDNASPEEIETLIKECENMMKIGGHPNIIEVYGTSIINGSRAIVMELADHGDLREFLREYYTTNRKEIVNLDKSEEASYIMTHCPRMFLFLWHIAKGMEYLSDLKILHRDLAARNILLSKGPVAKISDFGLSRDVYEAGYYYQESGGRLPYKWMSPETLINGKYTTESDVWSYGVLAWEVVTLGSTPFPGIPPDMLISMHTSGYIMPKPSLCPDDVYDVMVNCWKYEPDNRTTFQKLVTELDDIIQRGSKQTYMDLSKENLEDVFKTDKS